MVLNPQYNVTIVEFHMQGSVLGLLLFLIYKTILLILLIFLDFPCLLMTL